MDSTVDNEEQMKLMIGENVYVRVSKSGRVIACGGNRRWQELKWKLAKIVFGMELEIQCLRGLVIVRVVGK